MDNAECQERVEWMFNENKIQDLQEIIKTRNYLLKSNVYFAYTFHVLQSAGIFLVALGNALQITTMSWIGMGLNTLASLFQALIQVNNKHANKLHEDLVKIKKNKYIDQGTVDYVARSGSGPETYQVQQMQLPFNRTQTFNPRAEQYQEKSSVARFASAIRRTVTEPVNGLSPMQNKQQISDPLPQTTDALTGIRNCLQQELPNESVIREAAIEIRQSDVAQANIPNETVVKRSVDDV